LLTVANVQQKILQTKSFINLAYHLFGIFYPKNTNFMVLQPYFFNNNFAVENNESKGLENNA
jgi:hypothetical protein